MAWTRVDHTGVGFNDADSGGAGHNVTLPGGGTAVLNSIDVIAIGSNTVVNSLTGQGFTAANSRVVNQGGYSYYRINSGGEGPTVNIKTSGNENTVVLWERWSPTAGFDVSAVGGLDGSGALANPTTSSGTLAQTGELVLAFSTMTDPNSGVQPANPSWSTGFTAGDSAFSSAGATTTWAAGFSGYKSSAGTAAESPVVTWDTSAERNRYIFILAFKLGTGATSVNIGQVTETDAPQSLARVKRKTLGLVTESDTARTITRLLPSLGSVQETDTAQKMGARKSKTLGQAGESDSTFTVSRQKRRALGQPSEAGTAQSTGRTKAKAFNQSTETETPQGATRQKRKTLGLVTEADAVFSLSHRKLRTLGSVLELDTVLQINPPAASAFVPEQIYLIQTGGAVDKIYTSLTTVSVQ